MLGPLESGPFDIMLKKLFLLASWAFSMGAQPILTSPRIPLPPKIQEFSAWVVRQGDAGPRVWAVLDKKAAQFYLFSAAGVLQATSPVLLGSAVGDDSVHGIGDRKIRDIRPAEKITPAGRFVTEPGANLQGEAIVWVDYDASVSMHRVRAIPGESRLNRLSTPTARDNRISFGCINIPSAFYERWIKPSFENASGIVYVLPETRAAAKQFGAALSF